MLGGRRITWELSPRGVEVAHPGVTPLDQPVAYPVAVVTTQLPSDGSRFWWSCPACEKRVDSLYLPAGRARLGCRRCYGLAYRSQYRKGKVRRRKPRPVATMIREKKIWTPSTGWVLVYRREVRR
ncbi:MAG: hypothetical protein JWO38_2292 [Gemmataceae bacterium]|nr:hypothetical protein [Gemmataceae bacterium]